MKGRLCYQVGTACLLSLFISPVAHAELQPGDIVVIRVHSGQAGLEDSDGFTWLALRDIDAEEVPWTDASWGATNVDGVRQGWQTEDSGSAEVAGRKITGPITAGTMGDLNFATGFSEIDQIFFYSGQAPGGTTSISEEEAGLLFGVNWGRDSGWTTSGSVSNANSYEPEGIANLGMTMALGVGTHWYYSGPVTGNAEQLLAEIRNPDNWSIGDSTKTTWEAVRNENFLIQVPEPATSGLIMGSALAALGLFSRLRSRNGCAKVG